MVVEWAKLEANRAKEIHMVDVRELNLKKNGYLNLERRK